MKAFSLIVLNLYYEESIEKPKKGGVGKGDPKDKWEKAVIN